MPANFHNALTDTPANPKPETPNPEQLLSPSRFALVLAALLAVTFWRVLFGGEAFFYRDYGFLGYPFAYFHRECFWNGDFFPLWNPYVNCGAPFLAQWNTLCLYPGALIYLLLPLPWSLGFFCVAHLFLGGTGMRALAERWTGSRFGAAVAGVAFVFSGLALGCVIYPNYLVALGWMPWVALATRRAWQEGGRSIVLAALAGAMQMLSGAPEIILLTWGYLVGLAVVDVGVRRKTENVSRSLLTRYVLRFTSVPLLITGLCAAQLLPFFQLLSLSQRSGDAVNTFWSLPGWGWVNLFFPLFMNFQTEQGVFVMIGQSFFPSVYLGIVPLTLALLAAWRVRTPEVKLLGAATLLAVLLAMGDNFVLWRWLREVLPLGIMRFPVKMLLLTALTVPLLAAWGAKWVCNQACPTVSSGIQRYAEVVKAFAFVMAFPFLLAIFHRDWFNLPMLGIGPSRVYAPHDPWWRLGLCVLAWSGLMAADFSKPTFGKFAAWWLLTACVVSDSVFRQGIFNPTIPAAAFEPGLAAAYHASKGALTPAPKLGEGRIMLSPQAERALHTRMVPKFYDDFIGQRLACWGNLNLLDGLPKVNGASTLVAREWNDVEYFLYGTTNPAPANLMDFLGVTHTTKPGELMQWERRETAMPLVSFPTEAVLEYRGASFLAPLARPDWNPRSVAYLTFAGPDGGYFTPTQRPPFSAGSVRLACFSPTRLELETDTIERRPLVVAQNHYPCWRATVNGETEQVAKANHAFQAVMVPAGKSTVRLDYVDWPFRLGAALSLLTACGCLLLWRKPTSSVQPPAE